MHYPDVLSGLQVNAKDRKYPRLTGRAGDMGKKFLIG